MPTTTSSETPFVMYFDPEKKKSIGDKVRYAVDSYYATRGVEADTVLLNTMYAGDIKDPLPDVFYYYQPNIAPNTVYVRKTDVKIKPPVAQEEASRAIGAKDRTRRRRG